ncbi:CPBP family intramembrane glutamic endopeptidase [Natrinema versiforme]|uniref:CPBP family intramembrane metalloprotease n=1 Tax=Natrinema versiforme TaxID=88724 RepID=A0A4P8WI80_9EURY|nr:CPBP family intramembrane glutamic endopeptidase [Natrinema versiforme]QCS42924.1 CPBP family intramembrane metalloprotease [Natrinema versiforme]
MAESTADGTANRSISERLLYDSSRNRLRATWRILVPLVVAMTIYAVGQVLVNRFAAGVLEATADGASKVVATAVLFLGVSAVVAFAGVAGLFVASRLDGRSISSYGFDASRRWVTDFAAGAGIGVAASAGAIGYQVARGYVTLDTAVTGVGVDSPLLGGIVLLVLVPFFLANNAFEEIVFRAVLIGNAAEGLRSRLPGSTTAVVGAVAVTLPVFGALHLFSGGLATVITSAIGGVLFATAYVLTGQLALPIGVHFGGVVVLSVRQQPVSTDPELTLPSLIVAEQTGNPSLLVGVEFWIVRLLFGVALICLWLYAMDGEVSIAERVLPADADREE